MACVTTVYSSQMVLPPPQFLEITHRYLYPLVLANLVVDLLLKNYWLPWPLMLGSAAFFVWNLRLNYKDCELKFPNPSEKE